MATPSSPLRFVAILLSFNTITAWGQPAAGKEVAVAALIVKSQLPPINSAASTPATRFSVPAGFQRQAYKENSFQYYLSQFPLKPMGAKVYYYDGRLKPNQSVSISVLDIDVGNKDLQQCPDAVMRLRAEYLYEKKRFDEIHFNLTNGSRIDYSKWAAGYRLKRSGNNTLWYKAIQPDHSHDAFKEYLQFVFMYAGTLSLSKELRSIPVDSVQAGDVFIRGGSPGHAVIVMDVAINPANNKRMFLIAQSYMPAQNIHVLVNNNNEKISPWYDLSETNKLYTPEWTFEKSELKRFQQ